MKVIWIMNILNFFFLVHVRIQRGDRGPDSPGKSQVAIGFLRNTGTDPIEKPLDPRGLIAS